MFPDPNERSKNEPRVLVGPAQILGLYNQYINPTPKKQDVTSDILNWFKVEALNRGWDICECYGHQCILTQVF